MNESMEEEAVQTAAFALSQKQSDKDIASYMKQEFDKKYKPEWSCVVGRDFGSFVMHQPENIIYFYLGNRAFLLFKSV
ncbi:Dynein light chain cytoplasmic [Fasciolopsis buskii]|uniref:Dynein light chain n=1 Tax=Fasciolopsis buskii TaxID=27845 RepID=A0A8E0RYA9_9TREM|nr:Dynein light chain cytoplasmic [Fasciolopsis buski]